MARPNARFLVQLLKAARPGFWPTQLWFFTLPLGQRDLFGTWTFWLGAAYVCFPLGLLLYGMNDLADRETDRLNPRKDSWLFGARLSDQDLDRLPWFIAAAQVPFAIACVWARGWTMLAWFAAAVAVNALYNGVPFARFAFKNWPVVDLLNQVGYLLIIVLASWLCAVPQLNGPALLFSALFAMQSHLFGQVMDIDADVAAGRKTTASVLGVRVSKLLQVVFLVALALIAARHFRGFFVEDFLGAAAVFFLLDALFLFKSRLYPSWFTKLFFAGWNVVVLASMHFVWRNGVFLLR